MTENFIIEYANNMHINCVCGKIQWVDGEVEESGVNVVAWFRGWVRCVCGEYQEIRG